ncbi:MAG TPA: DUF6036 family nucleotidyltransferase [Isosphaeraceae bacterium]|nr:DUF6036 family nucleotidyltransferase [Isosphaeraceae bacterium]
MSQTPATLDPWRLVWGQPYIDSRTLAAAIEQDLLREPRPDFRTRLLVRDAAVALRGYWGAPRFAQWLAASPVGPRVRAILEEDLGETGFPAIRRRLVDSIDSIRLRRIFDLLGRGIHDRIEVHIAGSIPTLIKGLTARPTGDIDFVDEVPAEIRRQQAVLRQIKTDFGLKLGHVQSHYLPEHWQDRRQWLGDFGGLRVYVVDEYDIFVSKLSSKQEKHQSDLGVLALKLDKETARRRLLTDGGAFLDDPKLRPQIEENWRFIFQEPLLAKPERQQGHQDPGDNQDTPGTTRNGNRPKRPRQKRREQE